MRDKAILFTRGMRFIGSHLPRYLLNKHPNYYIINIDALIYAGGTTYLNSIKKNKNYKFNPSNICNSSLIQAYDMPLVVHLAASHIDKAIYPNIFVNNSKSIFNFLETSKLNWLMQNKNSSFLQTSINEVYSNRASNAYFPGKYYYSLSSLYRPYKIFSNFLIKSYLNISVLISDYLNNYGLKQYDKKLIPTTFFKSTL